jgi:hypothetical protein
VIQSLTLLFRHFNEETAGMARQAGTNNDLLAMALVGYQAEIARIQTAIREIQAKLGNRGPKAAADGAAPAKRVMSAAARRRIGAAQRKRWAAVREAKAVAAPKKRKLSAAGRRAIIAATKKRWAAVRKAAAKKAKTVAKAAVQKAAAASA